MTELEDFVEAEHARDGELNEVLQQLHLRPGQHDGVSGISVRVTSVGHREIGKKSYSRDDSAVIIDGIVVSVPVVAVVV